MGLAICRSMMCVKGDFMQAGYPSSWYAHSVGDHDDYPALTGSQRADVCIIGGGFTGLSAACTLMEAGKSVVLLEAHQVGWGASGRNGGQMIRGFVGQEKLAKRYGEEGARAVDAMMWAGHDLIRRRIDDYGIKCDLTPGWLEVASTPRQLAALYHHYNEMETKFPDRGWHFMGVDELRATMGGDHFLGGLLSLSDGHLHPLKLCVGLARGAASKGAAIHEHSPVTAIEPGQQVRVMTADGEVTADHLLLAANVHHQLPIRELTGAASAAASYMMATEPLDSTLLQELNPKGYAICDTKKVCDYFRMSSDGRVLFGGRVNYSGRKPKSVQAKLLPRLLRIWPQLEGVKTTHEWGGRLGVPYGEVPLIGRVGDNIWYGAGYTGHGVNMGNLAGDMLGKAIAGVDTENFNLFAKMPKRRVPFGHLSCARWLGQQVVSLAVFYYWLKDRL